MATNSIDDFLRQYSGYGSTNSALPQDQNAYTSPVEPQTQIQTTTLPSMTPNASGEANYPRDVLSNQYLRLPPEVSQSYHDQADIATNIMNEKDPKEFHDVVSYAMTDNEMDPAYKAMLRNEYAKRYLSQREYDEYKDHFSRVPPTDYSKVISNANITDLEQMSRPLTDKERKSAAWTALGYRALGQTKLADEWEAMAFPQNTYSSEMLMDGSRYTVERNAKGKLMSAFDSTGRRVSGEEFARVSAGSLSTGKKGIETSPTIGFDKDNVPYTKSIAPNGVLYFTNKRTGVMSQFAPDGWRETVDYRDALAGRTAANIRQKLTEQNAKSLADGGSILWTDDQIQAAADDAVARIYGQGNIQSGGGLSVSNDTSPAVQPLDVPANKAPSNVSKLVELNNPGGIRDMKNGGFMRYSTPEEGDAAQDRLLSSNTYKGLTLSQIPAKWAPAGDGNNNPAQYTKTLKQLAPGLDFDKEYNELTTEEKAQFRNAQAQIETGVKGGLTSKKGGYSGLQINTGDNSPSDVIEKAAQQVANYEAPPPKETNAHNARILARAKEINPGFKAVNYDTFKEVSTSFVSGDNSKQLRATKNTWQDIDKFEKVGLALKNGDKRLFNKYLNEFNYQLGSDEVASFETVKKALSGEIAKVTSGGAATVKEIAEFNELLGAANSPQQIIAVANKAREITAGRAKTLRDIWVSAGGNPKKFDEEILNEPSLVKAMIIKHADVNEARAALERKKAANKEGNAKPTLQQLGIH